MYSRVVEQRHPHDLRAAVADDVRPERDLRVVVRDVELPRHARLLQLVEDRRPRESGLRHIVRIGRVRTHPEEMVRPAAVSGRAEEAVEQHVLVGQVPVIRDVRPVVVPHDVRRVDTLQPEDVREAVHLPVVVLAAENDRVVSDVGDRAAAEPERRDALPFRVVEVDGHARPGRRAVRAAPVGAEVVVERVVLLEQVDEMVDRRARVIAAAGARERIRRLRDVRVERLQRRGLDLLRPVDLGPQRCALALRRGLGRGLRRRGRGRGSR